MVAAGLIGVTGQSMATHGIASPSMDTAEPTIPAMPTPTVPPIPTPTIPAIPTPPTPQAVDFAAAVETQGIAQATRMSRPTRPTGGPAAENVVTTQSAERGNSETQTTPASSAIIEASVASSTIYAPLPLSTMQGISYASRIFLPSLDPSSPRPTITSATSSTVATSNTSATLIVLSSVRLDASTSQMTPGHTSIPQSTATAGPSPKQPENLSPGTKAAIALGVFLFALTTVVLATFIWRRRRRIRKGSAASRLALSRRYSAPPEYSTVPSKGFPIISELHPATVQGTKYRQEMRASTTPRYNSWAPTGGEVRTAELEGGWGPSEVDGRPER